MKTLLKLVFLLVPINAWAVLDVYDELYTITGSNDYLYSVNSQTGNLTQIGNNSFTGVNCLSFHPAGSLWGWIEGKGLIKIDVQTGQSELMLPATISLSGMAWRGYTLYGAIGSTLWSYDGKYVKQVCDLSSYTSYLAVVSKESILIESNGSQVFQEFDLINLDTCQLQSIAKPHISIEQERKSVTINKGKHQKVIFALNLSTRSRTEYQVSFTQEITSQLGLFNDYFLQDTMSDYLKNWLLYQKLLNLRGTNETSDQILSSPLSSKLYSKC